MRNIFEILYRFRVFLLFLFLESIAIVLLVQNFAYQRSLFFNSSNQLIGNFYTTVSSVREYFLLRDINDKLQEENKALREQLNESKYSFATAKDTVIDTTLRQKYMYIEAEVIRNTLTRQTNFMTLNRGSRQGIEPGMGVISADGVAGEVLHVSANFSVVTSVLNTNTLISPKIEENDYFGSLTWDGKDPNMAILREINIQAPVKVGQKVVTSNHSLIYPENIPIGTIAEVKTPAGANFYDIRVKLSTNFGNLRKVYVIKNLLKDEQDQLEEKTRDH